MMMVIMREWVSVALVNRNVVFFGRAVIVVIIDAQNSALLYYVKHCPLYQLDNYDSYVGRRLVRLRWQYPKYPFFIVEKLTFFV